VLPGFSGASVARLRRVALRSLVALGRVLRGSRGILPHRSRGAVQEPQAPTAEPWLVQGWAWFGRDTLAAVHVTIDGVVVVDATLGPPRPDVAAARPATRGASRCSWDALVDLTPYEGREIKLGALAVPERGVPEVLTAIRAFVRPRTVGVIESPPDGAVVPPGGRRVSGWALPTGAVPARIHVRVDGRDSGLARPLASPRPDVASRRPDPAAPVAGFEHFVVLEGRPRARVRLEADVEDLTGRRYSMDAVELVIGAPPPHSEKDRAELDRTATQTRPLPQPRTHVGVRLVVFTHRLDLGGGQLYLQELLRHLVAEGQMSCLVVSAVDGPLRRELSSLGVRVEVGDFPVDTDGYRSRRDELEQLVADHGANIALVNTMGAGIGADVAQRCGIPTVWIIRESYTPEQYWPAAYGEGRVAPAVRQSVERALGRTEAVVFEADATRAAYAALCADRAVTIPHGVPLGSIDDHRAASTRDDARRELGIDPGDTLLLTVGSVEPRKAQVALAIAFAEIATDFPHAQLVIVGDAGTPYAVAVREVIERLRGTARIRLEPAAPDPHDWYLAADAFILASDTESLPRVLLEAMAYELPVAATAVWGIPSLVEDGRTGLLFQPRDVGAVVDVLRRLLTLSPDERVRLGAQGAVSVRERHDPAIAEHAIHALVHGLAVDPTARPEELLAP